MPAVSLAEFVTTFDRSSLQPFLAEAERDREKFRTCYPIANLSSVTLEEYAAGGDGDAGTLARMLAIGTPALGDVRGAAFNQTRIFRLKGTGLYKSRLENAGEAAGDWLRLRAALVNCCELAAAGDWDAVDRVPVSNWIPAIRTKLLHIYFPDQVLPMYVSGEMAHYLEALRIGFSPGDGRWAAAPNRHLLLHLRSMPKLAGWNTMELVHLLRAWFPKPKNATAPAGQREAILRAMRELRELDPAANDGVHHEEMKQYVAENYGIQIADPAAVMGYMVAPRFYTANESLNKYPLKDRQLESLGQGRYRLISTSPAPENNNSAILSPIVETPALNQILYGPPGTGKTYSVIREAAHIVAGESSKQSYDEAVQQGRIRLATFHQSFSYEDFIEGIRPVMSDSASFEVRDGVFKEIATDALFACLERNNRTSQANDDDSVSPAPKPTQLPETDSKRPSRKGPCLRVWEIADEMLEDGVNAPPSYVVVDAAIAEGIKLNTAKTQYSLWKNEFKEKNPRQLPASPSASAITSFYSDFSYVEKLSHKQKRNSVIAYLTLGPASGWQLRADKKYPPYVLIIDEINRGNISRIFGELITLIEDDKRHGEANALVVTLPSSRELFTVPPNLFLLGTMNTADKSLALLDVALRRRFEFNELSPDFSVCEGLPAEMRKVMDVMNHRLEIRKDRDHRIGHAFFIGITDAAGFNRVFRRKVVPLLQEYFFNDIEGARYVLGEENSSADTKGFLRTLNGHSHWQRNRWRWFTDEKQEMDCWERLSGTLGIVEA